MSRTVPSARTSVSASTQSRVVPYLKVAAPAALVATMPPAVAPVNVGAGGNQPPSARKRCCIAATVTPGSTVMRRAHIEHPVHLRRRQDRFAHRRGAPVSDDCAPIGSTAAAGKDRVDDVLPSARKDDPRGVTAGKVGGVDEKV